MLRVALLALLAVGATAFAPPMTFRVQSSAVATRVDTVDMMAVTSVAAKKKAAAAAMYIRWS